MSTVSPEQTKQHFDAILAVHPDALALAKTDDFLGWVSRQPPMIQQAVKSGTDEDVIDVLTRYKKAVGIRKKPRSFTSAQISAMSQEEFNKREKEIDEAIAAGLVT